MNVTPFPSGGGTSSAARTPPHNYEAEQALLGAILSNNRVIDRVSEFLKPEHFAEPLHGRIFEICLSTAAIGRTVNPITLKSRMAGDAGLQDAGGDTYLARLAGCAATIINAADYGRLVYDLHLRRELISLGEAMVDEALQPDQKVAADLAHDFEARLFAVTEGADTRDGGSRDFSSVLGSTIEQAQEAMRRGDGLRGLSTGLAQLDELIGGLARENLIVLASGSGMGKTTLATSVASHVAATSTPVGIFSLEMSSEEIAQRVISNASGVSYAEIAAGRLSDRQWASVSTARRELAALPLHIDDTPGLSIEQIRVRARRMCRRHHLGLIIIDHLHLIRGRGRDRLAELTAISASLKEMAKELGVPVLALSQLNRESSKRDDKRPHLFDLRESGSIEQDADVVVLLYRKAYFLERGEPERKPHESKQDHTGRMADWHDELMRERHRAQIIVEKNRHGQTGVVTAYCDMALSRFRDIAAAVQEAAA